VLILKNKILAIIPARGGSKGVKNKNVQLLGGIPLICHSINFCEEIKISFLVTTDSDKVWKSIEPYFKRNVKFNDIGLDKIEELSKGRFIHRRVGFEAKDESLISDLLFKLSKQEELVEYEYFLLLQPTSPLRAASDLDAIVSLATQGVDWSSIFSGREVGGNHPNRMYRIIDDLHAVQLDGFKSQDNIPRQQLEKIFIKDGAYYFFKKENLRNRIFIGETPVLYQRSLVPPINIDTEFDLFIARTYWSDIHENHS
jgi:CMP-N-acetylneuraminic acid synthetase